MDLKLPSTINVFIEIYEWIDISNSIRNIFNWIRDMSYWINDISNWIRYISKLGINATLMSHTSNTYKFMDSVGLFWLSRQDFAGMPQGGFRYGRKCGCADELSWGWTGCGRSDSIFTWLYFKCFAPNEVNKIPNLSFWWWTLYIFVNYSW